MKSLASLRQSFLAQVPFTSIRRAVLAYEHGLINGKKGIDIQTRERGIPEAALKPPRAHLDDLRERGLIGDGPAITLTHRNLVQNLRCVCGARACGICQALGEESHNSQRPYYCMVYSNDGAISARALDLRQPLPDDMEYFWAGIPVLWRGRVLTCEEMAPEVFDPRHLWRLHIDRQYGHDPEHVDRFRRLSAAFWEVRHKPAAEAGKLLCWIAAGLERENNYLHHAVGTSDEAVLVIVTNGPLEEIGRIAHSMGARDALVVENGGSVQIGYRRRDGSWRPIFESYYFREPSIALAVYELRQPGEGEFVFTGDWTLGATT